ncbi:MULTISPECIES: DUF2897 family protein [Gammaproteobacteria]|uniref:DUF2897 family protein n=1 Tax=Gammaproteobacteria TaxID=1236 RepID=UPI000DD06055|nr:DUF2897 family protein [Aliidiomarina sp. B3213]RTE87040.1 DUF2897 family protein [Aliidiomarina sp. B3213]TCZ93170.1 DUF2897 family protein [Lysobacter sp. N42]
MSLWWTALIIALVLGIIVSNILLVKYTANMKMPKIKDPDANAKGSSKDASKWKKWDDEED